MLRKFVMGLIVQIGGSLLVLAGFALAQAGVLNQRSRVYLIFNAIGSAILTVSGALDAQWGFVLLEGVWALVSLASLLRIVAVSRRSRPRASHSPAT